VELPFRPLNPAGSAFAIPSVGNTWPGSLYLTADTKFAVDYATIKAVADTVREVSALSLEQAAHSAGDSYKRNRTGIST
jgi:hypothetical protein